MFWGAFRAIFGRMLVFATFCATFKLISIFGSMRFLERLIAPSLVVQVFCITLRAIVDSVVFSRCASRNNVLRGAPSHCGHFPDRRWPLPTSEYIAPTSQWSVQPSELCPSLSLYTSFFIAAEDCPLLYNWKYVSGRPAVPGCHPRPSHSVRHPNPACGLR